MPTLKKLSLSYFPCYKDIQITFIIISEYFNYLLYLRLYKAIDIIIISVFVLLICNRFIIHAHLDFFPYDMYSCLFLLFFYCCHSAGIYYII